MPKYTVTISTHEGVVKHRYLIRIGVGLKEVILREGHNWGKIIEEWVEKHLPSLIDEEENPLHKWQVSLVPFSYDFTFGEEDDDYFGEVYQCF